MFVIFGLAPRTQRIESGRFHCPYEDQESSYRLFRESEWFSLFFIPVFKVREAGHFVECLSCGSRYPRAVLQPKSEK